MYWEKLGQHTCKLSVGNLYEAVVTENANDDLFGVSVSCAGKIIKEWDNLIEDELDYYKDQCYNLIIDSCKEIVKYSTLDRRGYR